MISRRGLLAGSAAIAAFASLPKARATNTNGTIPGAIRWDAWYGTSAGSSESFVNGAVDQTLGPSVFQSRAPWFAAPISPYLNNINGNSQSIMDQEIAYAASAGLKYWAYCWYGEQSPASPMQNAWALHQSSSSRNNVNWCLLWQLSRLSSAGMSSNQSTYVGYFQQTNYQTVLSGRPLVYIFWDTTTYTNFGGSISGIATAITNLRTACSSAGVGNPYIAVMYGTPATAASLTASAGADAISNYTAGSNTGNATAWTTFEPTVESFWSTMGATGTPIIPICMDGMDSRPRKFHPAGLVTSKPNVSGSAYVLTPTAAQLTTHLQAAVSYVTANPTQCPSKAILIYAWDECDEFGCIMPTYNAANPASPNTTMLNAVGAVTW